MDHGGYHSILEEAGQKPHRTAPEKVAILLLSLGNPLGPKLLQSFGADDVKAVMSAAASLGTVNRDDLDTLIDDFAAEFGRALGIETSESSVRNLVEQAFAPEQLTSMFGTQGLKPAETVWRKFQAGSENILTPYLLDEHPQTAAYVIANLEPDIAAKCLGLLPKDMRESVIKRLLDMAPVTERAGQLLQECLREDLLMKADKDDKAQGVTRLATLLNRLDREQSAALMDAIAGSRPDIAGELRGLVFAFEDIETLPQPARVTLFDKVPTEQVIAALRGMPQSFRDVVLVSLSARSKRMVEAELATDKGQAGKDSLAARRAVADLALDMAQRGEIVLRADG